MPKKIEDVLPDVWSTLEKLGLNDLQIYRVWQAITGELAEAGWLRKRPGKPHLRGGPYRGAERLGEAEAWLEQMRDEYGIDPEPKKKDHISTTELINEEAKKERQVHAPFLGPGRRSLIRTDEELDREAARQAKRKRKSQW